jgi:hypothetical protein
MFSLSTQLSNKQAQLRLRETDEGKSFGRACTRQTRRKIVWPPCVIDQTPGRRLLAIASKKKVLRQGRRAIKAGLSGLQMEDRSGSSVVRDIARAGGRA